MAENCFFLAHLRKGYCDCGFENYFLVLDPEKSPSILS